MADFERTMDMICGQAEEALEKSARKADFESPKDAEAIKNLMKILYYADNMGASGEGYSQTGSYAGNGSTGNNGNMAYSGGYDRESSYQRRDSRGRYSRNGNMGYSGRRGYSRGSLMDHIDELMGEATTDQERQALERLRRELER